MYFVSLLSISLLAHLCVASALVTPSLTQRPLKNTVLNLGNRGLFNDEEDPYLEIWVALKKVLPSVVTGAYRGSEGDDNPAAALYNTVFVRTPTIWIGLWFLFHNFEGGEFNMDFGAGPVSISQTAIGLVMFLILRPRDLEHLP